MLQEYGAEKTEKKTVYELSIIKITFLGGGGTRKSATIGELGSENFEILTSTLFRQ